MNTHAFPDKTAAGAACCDQETRPTSRRSHGNAMGAWRTAAEATLHCLAGCVVGEIAGLSVGVTLGFPPAATIALATLLAYISGFTLGLLPVMRREKVPLLSALQLIWVGEAVSIAVMEIAMNAVDYAVGGMGAPSVLHPAFWYGIAAAVPAGFIAALPVNVLLLRRGLKKCH